MHELGDGMPPAPDWASSHRLQASVVRSTPTSSLFRRGTRVPREWRKHQHQHQQRDGKRGVHVHLPCRRHRACGATREFLLSPSMPDPWAHPLPSRVANPDLSRRDRGSHPWSTGSISGSKGLEGVPENRHTRGGGASRCVH